MLSEEIKVIDEHFDNITQDELIINLIKCGLGKIEDLQPEIIDVINDNFWDLV